VDTSNWIALCAVGISIGSLVVSILAKQEAKNAARLSKGVDAIGHVRLAIGDILIRDHIDKSTVADISEAYQLAEILDCLRRCPDVFVVGV